MKDRIHICYCINRKMLEPMCVSAYSALASIGERDAMVWVFHSDLGPPYEQEIRRVLSDFESAELKFEQISLTHFSGVKGLHGEVMPFAKIILPYLMRDRVDRLVFLDADTVVVSGLDELCDLHMDRKILAAVSYESLGRAQEAPFFAKHKMDLEKPGFNSGVMLVDVRAWNQEAMSQSLIDLINGVDPNDVIGDQPFLNVAFYDDFLQLPIRYNKRASPGSALGPSDVTTGIVHFIGIPKPWDPGGRLLNLNAALYDSYRRRAGVESTPSITRWQQSGVRRVGKGIFAGIKGLVKNL